MATSGNNNQNNGKKKSRSQRRRDTETAVFNELANLLPISKDVQQDKLSILRLTIAYLKVRSGLESDEEDLEACLTSSEDIHSTSDCYTTSDDVHGTSGYFFDTYCESGHEPLAMLDNEGTLIAGSLNMNKNSANTEISDIVWSDLEEQFIFDSEQVDNFETHKLKEKFKKYKENLEKGMQEFLNHDMSDISCHFNNSASTRLHTTEKENNTVHMTSSEDAKTTLSSQTSSNVCKKNRIYKHSKIENKFVSETHYSSAALEKTDQQLTIPKPTQESNLILEAAAGFIISLDKDKRVLFVSENVSKFLGHCQLFMIGQDVSEFIYEQDYQTLEMHMSDTQFQEVGVGHLQPWQVKRTFYMAMKFCFQKSGSRVKDPGLQLYQWNAKLRLYKDRSTGNICVKGLTSLCCPTMHDSILSISDNANLFTVRLSLKDSKILYCDPKIQDLLGYNPNELVGINHSLLKHPSDMTMCRFNYRNLFQDGKCTSGYYRLLSRMGYWVWMYTNINVIYNKNSEAEVLVMRNIIVSQAEAQCVLSREKKEFKKLQNLGYNVDQYIQGRSQPSVASITFEKQRKKKKISFDEKSTDSDVSPEESKIANSLSKCVFLDKTNQSNSLSPHLQKEESNSPQPPKPANKFASTSQKNKKSVTGTKNSRSAGEKKNDSVQKLMHNFQAVDNSDKKTNQTMVTQCISQNTVTDSFPSSDSSSHSESPAKSVYNLTDSESFAEIPSSQHKKQGISSNIEGSSSLLHLSSLDQSWTLESYLFDNDQQGSRLNHSPTTSSNSIITNTYPSPEQANHAIKEIGFTKSNNNQLAQKKQTNVNQRKQMFPFGSWILPSSSIQSNPESLMNDDQSLDGVLDFLTEESLPATKVLMTPFSGDIMLPSITAPQSITLKNQQQKQSLDNHLNTHGFQDVTSENKCHSMQLGNEGVISLNTITNNEVTADLFAPACGVHQNLHSFTFNKFHCKHQPVVAGQSEAFYSSGKLDYPPKKYYLKNKGTFDELEDFQTHASNVLKMKSQTEVLGGSCSQSSQRNDNVTKLSAINSNIQISNIQEGNKIIHESSIKVGHESSVSDFMFTSINESKHSLTRTCNATTNITSSSAGNGLPDFGEGFDKAAQNTNKSGIVESIIISKKKNQINLVNNSSEDIACSNECTLPEDLIDLELDTDIAVDLSENLFKYL